MEYLATGVLKGPHGIKGYSKLRSFSGSYDHLSIGMEILLKKDDKSQTMIIEDLKPSGDEVLIKFEGISSPEAARALSALELWVPRTEASPLEDGEVYVADLMGCSLMVDNEKVANVVGFIDGPQSILLDVVTLLDGKHYLVPYMKHYIGKVSLEEKEIELLNPWLLT